MFDMVIGEAHLTLSGITKRFGALQALQNVTISFSLGEIHAVIGENGAGKSTLMNVIGGFVSPDDGTGFIGGKPLAFGNPMKCRAQGIEIVHQHFMLVPEFRVIENLALSSMGTLASPLQLPYSRYEALAAELGWKIDLTARTGSLPVGVQQRVEILKALAADSSVLILDEPTAVLSDQEVEDLFQVLRRLREQGKAIVLIAHKLREVLSIADRISVLRGGKLVGSVVSSEASESLLQTWMLGDPSVMRSQETAKSNQSVTMGADPALQVQDLRVKGDRGEMAVNCRELSVRRGEVVGIGGVDGNGQQELAEALVGIRPREFHHLSVPERIGYIPQDRQTDGLALNMTVRENLMISGTKRSRFFEWPRQTASHAMTLVEKYKIKVQNINDRASALSGGNQQKIVVSRTLEGDPELLIAVNPTRGLDFNAMAFVHESIREAARGGAGVLLITTDQDEFEELADRRLYIDRGEIHDEGWVR